MRFRKKPVVIDAHQWTHDDQNSGIGAFEKWPEWLRAACDMAAEEPGAFFRRGGVEKPLIQTLEGEHSVSVGDWIIRGVQGELYPCKPDIFAATYENADEPRLGDEGTTTQPVTDD